MAEKKLIVVMGATGNQGSGLVHAILKDPEKEFKVRAITRDAGSEKAKQLAALGAEVVSANLDDPESIKKAFQGAYGVYCVTFYWEHISPEKELQHAKTMADAVKSSKPQHVIWSTLEDTRKLVPIEDNRMPTLMGKYKVPHFDTKAEADKYFAATGVPVTFLIASFYWENLIFFGSGPKKDAEGNLALVLPMGNKKLAGVASEDIGKTAFGIFKAGDKYKGKTVGVAGEHLTINEMANKLSAALGQKVIYKEVSPDTFRSFGFPGADDVGNMFQFYRDFEEEGLKIRDISIAAALNPELQDFDTWLKKHKSEIPLN